MTLRPTSSLHRQREPDRAGRRSSSAGSVNGVRQDTEGSRPRWADPDTQTHLPPGQRDEPQGSLPRPFSWRRMVVLCCGWRGAVSVSRGVSLREPRKCCILSGLGEWRQNSPSGPGYSARFISLSAVFPASSGVPRRDPALQRSPDVLEAAVHRGHPCVGAPRPPSWPLCPLVVEMVIT